MSTFEISASAITAVAGTVLSVGFLYIPGFREWYAAKQDTEKRLIMAGLILLVALVVVGLSCSGAWPLVECTEQSGMEIAKAVVEALAAGIVLNQSVYSILPRPASVEDVKAARDAATSMPAAS